MTEILTKSPSRPQGQEITFRVMDSGHVLRGMICGISTQDQPVIGQGWIVRLLEKPPDPEFYPYECVIVFEMQILSTKERIEITRAVQTCFACPSQWDMWDANGNQYYVRYRWGHGRIQLEAGPAFDALEGADPEIFHWSSSDGLDGAIELEEVMKLASSVMYLSENVSYSDESLKGLT